MKVASPSMAEVDTGPKRHDYAALGIPEYWRFDETGNDHGTRLAGDILEGRSNQPISIEDVAPGILQGYSPVLNLIIRWEQGRLVWVDPSTQQPILTYEDQRDRADAERNRTDAEREARLQAEARNRELERKFAD